MTLLNGQEEKKRKKGESLASGMLTIHRARALLSLRTKGYKTRLVNQLINSALSGRKKKRLRVTGEGSSSSFFFSFFL